MYIINFGLFCSNARNETKQPVAIRLVSWSRSAKHRQVSVHDPRPNIISSRSYIGPARWENYNRETMRKKKGSQHLSHRSRSRCCLCRQAIGVSVATLVLYFFFSFLYSSTRPIHPSSCALYFLSSGVAAAAQSNALFIYLWMLLCNSR